ncbi:MAG: LCP family protein [Candidatus Margulisiibacteriota bacterium]
MNPLNEQPLVKKFKEAIHPSLIKQTVIKTCVVFLTLILLSVSTIYCFGLLFGKAAVVEFILAVMPKERLNGVNILAMGIDDTDVVQRSDTIIVMHIDDIKKRIGVLSIPRDTRTNVPGVGLTKINHAYAYGGEELLRKTVASLLNVRIDYYIQLRTKGVEQLVDALGGIDVNVNKNLYYIDKSGGLYVDLKKGQQDLNGKQAVEYLRFRHDEEGDLGRIHRQQGFLQSLAEKMIDSKNVANLPSVIGKMNDNISTDLNARKILGLATQFKEAYASGNIDVQTIPGEPILIKGVSYWQPDITQTDKLVQNVLMGFDTEKNEVVAKVQTVDKEASKDARRKVTLKEVSRVANQFNMEDLNTLPLTTAGKPMTVEVLNGLGRSGEARMAANLLRSSHIVISRYANSKKYGYKRTLIVDWKGNVDSSIALAQYLGIEPSRIIVYHRSDKPLDVTVVLGNDWPEIKQELEKRSREQR